MAHYQFSDKYIEEIFYLWHDNNCQSGKTFLNEIHDEEGRKPSLITIGEWVERYGWIERADALDAEISRELDSKIIDRRVKMFEEHAKIGKALIEKGESYLNGEFGISSDNAAIRAVGLGVEIERISVGQAEAWMKISKMTDEQIAKEFARLSGKLPNDVEIKDGEIKEESKGEG